jgi:RNA 3'-terminal phosphate cyclase (ATP)
LLRYGFYPAGGGKIVFEVHARRESRPINMCEPVKDFSLSARIYTAKLPVQIAQKQRKLLLNSGLNFKGIEHINVIESVGAGNCVVIRVCGNNRTIVFTGFGSRGKPSEKVVSEVVNEAQDFINIGAGINHYLADQLLIYMAIQQKGKFTTNQLSKHLTTNIEVIKKFLPVDFVVEQENNYHRICCVRL